MMKSMRWVLLGLTIVGLALVGRASADFLPGSSWTVTAGGVSETFTIGSTPTFTTTDGYSHWSAYDSGTIVDEQHPCTVRDASNTTVATIKGLYIETLADPVVRWGFLVDAGATDTTFRLSSPVSTFAPMLNPAASATAAVTVTDEDGNGATATGQFLDGALPKVYQFHYNSPPTTWTNLVDPVHAEAGSSAIGTSRWPSTGSAVIPAAVDQISTEYYFTLSANDQASGTSNFTVVPEPSTVALLAASALGVLACGWRRRAR
jgi:hypothetical protein